MVSQKSRTNQTAALRRFFATHLHEDVIPLNERQWLEQRFQRLEDQFREDNKAMEKRIVAQISELKDTSTTRLNDHSERIRTLENWRSWIAGLSAAAGAAGGWVVQLFREGRH